MSDNTEMPAEPKGHAARREFLKDVADLLPSRRPR
jgi:hypothetical protein